MVEMTHIVFMTLTISSCIHDAISGIVFNYLVNRVKTYDALVALICLTGYIRNIRFSQNTVAAFL